MPGLIGKKIGMTSVFSVEGKNMPCTVIEVGPCVVTQLKTVEKDGYAAIQLGFEEKKEKHTNKAEMGHFKKAGVKPQRHLVEFNDFEQELTFVPKIKEKDAGGNEVVTDGEKIVVKVETGATITAEFVFGENDFVDVIGTSKGKGFQGVVKRHGFGGVGQATHGQHNRLRAPGSLGASSYPSKVVKGMRMAGRMGGDCVTIQNLQVIKVIPEHNLVLVKGSVPGTKGSIVLIEK